MSPATLVTLEIAFLRGHFVKDKGGGIVQCWWARLGVPHMSKPRSSCCSLSSVHWLISAAVTGWEGRQGECLGPQTAAWQSLHWGLSSVCSINYIMLGGELPVQSHFSCKKDFLKTELLWYLKTDSVAEPRTCVGWSITGSPYARAHCASLLCLLLGFLFPLKSTDGLIFGVLTWQ